MLKFPCNSLCVDCVVYWSEQIYTILMQTSFFRERSRLANQQCYLPANHNSTNFGNDDVTGARVSPPQAQQPLQFQTWRPFGKGVLLLTTAYSVFPRGRRQVDKLNSKPQGEFFVCCFISFRQIVSSYFNGKLLDSNLSNGSHKVDSVVH